MTNEVLAKFVYHNIVVCIHEMFALGIEPQFGNRIEKEPVAVATEGMKKHGW